MWHVIFLQDKWTVVVRSKIRSAENNQSCKGPGKRIEIWILFFPALVFSISPLTLLLAFSILPMMLSVWCHNGASMDRGYENVP